jgi:hypothetical protein
MENNMRHGVISMERVLIIGLLVCVSLICAPALSRENRVSTLEIISINKVDTENPSNAACVQWKMNKSDILKSFQKMRRVTSAEWGGECYVYSCSYIGKAKYQGRTYDIEVNAGSYISLTETDGEKTLYFIERNASRSFIESCNCCDVGDKPK